MPTTPPFLDPQQIIDIFSQISTATALHIGEEAHIQFANDAMLSIWGKDRSVIGKSLEDALPELKGQPFIEMFARVWLEGLTISGSDTPAELNINGEDQLFYFDFEYRAILDENGKTICILHTATDVTDRFLKQSALQQVNEHAEFLRIEQALNEELNTKNEDLSAALEEIRAINDELHATKENLQLLNDKLDARVKERTETISFLNQELEASNEEIRASNEELMASNEEMLKFNQQLTMVYEKLKISQEEAALAIDAAGLGTFDFNPLNGSFSANDMLRKWFGIEGDWLELEKALQVIAEKDRVRVRTAISHSLDFSSGGDYEIDYQIINPKDPRPRIIKAKGKTHFDADKKPIRLSGVLQDVTEQVTGQEKTELLIKNLAASEQKFRRLIQQAPVAINVFRGHELIVESANERMLEIWNRTAEIEGKRFDEVLPEIADQPFIKILHGVLDSGLPYHGLESRAVIIKDNIPQERYFNFIYQPIEEAGKISSILQVVTEVTEQVNARKEISEANTRLSIAMDAGSLGSTEVDLASGTMKYNEQFRRIFGKKPDEDFVYSDMFEAMLPQYRDPIRELVSIAKENHSIYKGEYEIMWPDGSVHWISAHGRARYDNQGKPVKMVGVLSDITELKADEQRKNDFIGMVSHELKTPLTSLTGYVQLLYSKAQKNGDSFASTALDKANNQLKKMTGMINSFLNVSRLESGKIHIEKQNFDLSGLVSEMEAEFKVTANSHHLVFEQIGEVLVNADRDKIGHVVTNLISNAVKYSPVGTTINITCKKEDSKATVSVSDQGSGIKKEDKDKLFERYYRVTDQSLTIAGFGIGLYLCAEIISRHNGEIWLESELGRGSTFYFSLPL